MKLVELKKRREVFSDTPISLDDKIRVDFYSCGKGTYCIDIWHWFDEKLPNGLVADFNLV